MITMKEIANRLGIELGQKFNIIMKDGRKSPTSPCKFTEKGIKTKDGKDNRYLLTSLLIGDARIEEIYWFPSEGEEYYTPNFQNTNSSVSASKVKFSINNPICIIHYTFGLIFETPTQAIRRMEQVIIDNKDYVKHEVHGIWGID